jgi:hypothetical protein
VVIFCLFPFYWLVNISLKTGADLSASDLFPPNPSLSNYESIFQNADFTRALANSAIVSLVTTFLDQRHTRSTTTAAKAATPVASTSDADGSAWVTSESLPICGTRRDCHALND